MLKRRSVIELSGKTVLGACFWWLSGCGVPSTSLLKEDDEEKKMYDIFMEGWSTLGSGYLGKNGKLSAELIKKNQKITLNYIQDSHGHKFTLLPEHFYKLFKGEKVEVLTTEALQHKHRVIIDPKKQDKSSTPVIVTESDFRRGEQDSLKVIVKGEESVDLYIHFDQIPAEEQAFVCVGDLEKCRKENSWLVAKATKNAQSKNIWHIPNANRNLKDAQSIPVYIGRKKGEEIVIERSFKLTK